MKQGFLVFVVIFSFVLISKVGATPADSILVRQIIEKADRLGENNLNETFKLFGQAQSMARDLGHEELLADALLAESYYYFSSGNYERVIPQVREAGKIYQKLNKLEEEIKCHNREGLAHMYLNQYSEALRSLFLTKSLAEKSGNEKLIAAVNNNIGLVYESLNDWNNALVYAQQSLAIKLKMKDTLGLARIYGNIANLYYYQKEYDLALTYFHLANDYSKYAGNIFQLAITYSDMGNTLVDMGQLDSAIHYQYLALEIQSSVKDERFVEWCHTISSLGGAWLKKGDLKKALIYLNKCDSCEKVIPDFTFLKNTYTIRSEYYRQINDFVRATHYLQLLNNINDSILVQSEKFDNQRIAIQYEFNQKAREDSLRYELNISKQEMAATSYRTKMYLLLGALLAIAGISIAVIRRIKTKQELRRRIEQESMRHTIAGDLHDDIGSTLSSIQILSSMAADQCSNNPSMQKSIKQINELSDKVASGMREIVWSINPLNDNLEAITSQLHKLAIDILEPKRISFEFIKSIEQYERQLLPLIRKDLMMIFKEVLNNARKYSGASKVNIAIVQQEDYMQLTIKDNGCGFNLEAVRKGNGLRSIQRRADDMGATLSLSTKEGEGTLVVLYLPLPKIW